MPKVLNDISFLLVSIQLTLWVLLANAWACWTCWSMRCGCLAELSGSLDLQTVASLVERTPQTWKHAPKVIHMYLVTVHPLLHFPLSHFLRGLLFASDEEFLKRASNHSGLHVSLKWFASSLTFELLKPQIWQVVSLISVVLWKDVLYILFAMF